MSPNLSGPGVRQRPFPSSGAVLDVTGGGESEESQQGQEERGLRHGSWSGPLHLAGWLTAGPASTPHLISARTDVICVPFCCPRAAPNATRVEAQQMWPCIRCAPSNKCAQAAEDASSVFRAAPHLLEITFPNNLQVLRSQRASPKAQHNVNNRDS